MNWSMRTAAWPSIRRSERVQLTVDGTLADENRYSETKLDSPPVESWMTGRTGPQDRRFLWCRPT